MNNTPFQSNLDLSKNFFYFFFIALFSASLSIQSCNPAKGMVSQDSYSLDQNQIIKTNAISVMKKGAKSYSSMAEGINELKSSVDDLITYEEAKGEKNQKTVDMWKLMMNPEGYLLGGFLNRWETEDKLNATFIKESAGVISKNLDKIINLEKKKKKPKM